MYTLTFADGSVMEGLGLNGSNYISKTPVNPDDFTDEKLKTITIDDGEGTVETVKNYTFVNTFSQDGMYYFAFRPYSENELTMKKIHDALSTDSTNIEDLQTALSDLATAFTELTEG